MRAPAYNAVKPLYEPEGRMFESCRAHHNRLNRGTYRGLSVNRPRPVWQSNCLTTSRRHMIRKLTSGKYRLYSRKKNPQTGKRRNLGTFSTREAAERHEREVQFFKKH